MNKLYSIKDWEQDFETYETKKLTYLKWVPVPNKHDGLVFRKVAAQKNACELFSAWNLILQVASRGRRGTERGKLIRGGQPLTPPDLSLMTGFPAGIFERAFDFFSSREIAWLAVENVKSAVLTGDAAVLTGSPAVLAGDAAEKTADRETSLLTVDSQAPPEKAGDAAVFPADAAVFAGGPAAEGKGREGKEGNGRERAGANESRPASDAEFVDSLKSNPAYIGIDVIRELHKMRAWCQLHKKHPTQRRFLNWLNRCERQLTFDQPSVESLEQKIARHPANHEWKGYDSRKVTQDMRDELDQLKRQLREARRAA